VSVPDLKCPHVRGTRIRCGDHHHRDARVPVNGASQCTAARDILARTSRPGSRLRRIPRSTVRDPNLAPKPTPGHTTRPCRTGIQLRPGRCPARARHRDGVRPVRPASASCLRGRGKPRPRGRRKTPRPGRDPALPWNHRTTARTIDRFTTPPGRPRRKAVPGIRSTSTRIPARMAGTAGGPVGTPPRRSRPVRVASGGGTGTAHGRRSASTRKDPRRTGTVERQPGRRSGRQPARVQRHRGTPHQGGSSTRGRPGVADRWRVERGETTRVVRHRGEHESGTTTIRVPPPSETRGRGWIPRNREARRGQEARVGPSAAARESAIRHRRSRRQSGVG
jgi:hypothetical protein